MKALQYILDIWSKGQQPTRSDLYYAAATSWLGRDASPLDEAPDSLACVESLQDIFYKTFGTYIGPFKTLSTYVLLGHLKASPAWQRVSEAEAKPGAIVISPTGFSKISGSLNGHCGIVGEHGIIMSNNSFGGEAGMFTENYTTRSWRLYFQDRKQFPVYYFNLL